MNLYDKFGKKLESAGYKFNNMKIILFSLVVVQHLLLSSHINS